MESGSRWPGASGLSAAVEWQAVEFTKRTGIPCDISSDPEDIVLDQGRSIAIFRIFQETLTNIARHADARQVRATLRMASGGFEMHVRDDGKGILEPQVWSTKSFGLLGMRERAHDFGGTFAVRAGKKGGTTVELIIPTEEDGGSVT